MSKFRPPSSYRPETLAVRAGQERSHFNEHAEAMYLTSSFVFEHAAQAAVRFSGEEEGHVYSRFTNPTVAAFQARLAALEDAGDCLASASGMSAILSLIMGLFSAGDHVVASRSLFGATQHLLSTIMPRFGVNATFVSASDTAAWEAAVRPETRLFFLETPSNPLTEIADIAAIAAIAHRHGARLAVDNSFCTPVIQRPLALGADLTVYSATKSLDGQGRVLGGAVLGSKQDIEEIFKFMRTAGPTLSAFNAWVLLKGLETLPVRMKAQARSALEIARWLEAHPKVARVFYPGLPSHPQHALACAQQINGGSVLSFEVKGGRDEAWRVVDACKLISITGNLGDVKSTLTHPATTTHGRLSPEERAAAGISEALLRLSIGLEAPEDLSDDLKRGLSKV